MTVLRHCRPIDCAAVRAGLVTALSAVEYLGAPLRVNATFADTFDPPIALVGVFTVAFDDERYAGMPTAQVGVHLVAPVISLRPAQNDLDAMLSVYLDALQQDDTLQDTVSAVRPLNATPILTVRGTQEFPTYDCQTLVVF